MRLNKFLAEAGVASRRKCDILIDEGKVTVNGAVAEKGLQVDIEKDVVVCNKEQVTISEEKIYIMLNKPLGYVSTCSDDKGRNTVLDLINIDGIRLFPVGRLDYDTEGMLIITNDGDFSFKLIHPKYEVKKIYYATVSGVFTKEAKDKLEKGIRLDGVLTSKCSVEIIKSTPKSSVILVTISEGKNRQVRRMLEFLGFQVLYLKRESIGGLSLGNLAVGEWRYLTKKEINILLNVR